MQAKVSISSSGAREAVHDGQRFVGVPDGAAYSIEVQNLSRGRILAVVTVDGRNVIDASEAATSGPGCVLRGHQTQWVAGWRTSNSEVSEFTMGEAEGSYAAMLGSTPRLGVIGVAIYSESVAMRTPRAMPCASPSGEVMRGGGTGFGRSQESRATETEFVRSGEPEIHVIRYGTIRELVSQGVLRRNPVRTVSPFAPTPSAYCPSPATVSR